MTQTYLCKKLISNWFIAYSGCFAALCANFDRNVFFAYYFLLL